jgi:hypothetical protein
MLPTIALLPPNPTMTPKHQRQNMTALYVFPSKMYFSSVNESRNLATSRPV